MSSQRTGRIVISGQTPAQKNNKQIYRNRRTGNNFISSSDRVKEWQRLAFLELRLVKLRFKGRVQIDYMFYVVDNAQRDIDNMMASVNDVLHRANSLVTFKNGKEKLLPGTGIIQGDHWQKLRVGSADAEIDKENPRAEMVITVLEEL